MTYGTVREGRFISRPNRFIAKIELDGREETVHVKNTGRCRELLVPGCRVVVQQSANPARKTAYDLIAVYKEREGKPPLLINMDSQAPNKAALEWIKGGLFSRDASVYPEKTFGSSRFDLYVEQGDKKAFVEVKGVTLEQEGAVMFPDAPTERGVKHLRELAEAAAQGYEAYLLFVVQMKEVSLFRPNRATHPEFADALRAAADAGVRVLAVDCIVTPDSMTIDRFIDTDI